MTFSQRTRRLSLGAGTILAIALAAAPVLAAEHAVSIVGVHFEPAQLTAAVGDTVVWTVTESNGELHSVTSGKPGFVGQGGTSFDSGINLRDNGQSYTHTFEAAGVYDYFCQVHAVDMLGQVLVLEPGQSPPVVEPPPSEVEPGVPVQDRVLAGGILVMTLLVGFAGAWLWRRMNPA
jgi:plastocyanin